MTAPSFSGVGWRQHGHMTLLESKLGGLLVGPGITDLMVNGANQLWVQRVSGVLESAESPFESESELAEFAQGLIASGGRHLDQANPFADVAIDDYRVHAALASGCNPKTHLSIRVHANRLFGLDQLCDFEMFGPDVLHALRAIVIRRESYLISGPTGSGKTTLLRAMLAACAGERVIALEDVAELGLDSGHFIALQTRQANIEGKGEIGLDRLVREALRMRPDRLAVGEVRGPELLVMLQALNTGHSGAGATIHANSIKDVPSRLNAIGRAAGVGASDLAEMTHSAIQWVIHLSERKIVGLGKLSLTQGGRLEVVPYEI